MVTYKKNFFYWICLHRKDLGRITGEKTSTEKRKTVILLIKCKLKQLGKKRL